MYKFFSLLCVVTLALVHFVQAQELSERADRKITGQYFRPHTASAYHESAKHHARALGYYGRRYSQVPSETAKEHAAEIRRNVAAAQKEVAKLKQEAKDNKQVQQTVKAIEQHQAKVIEACDMLEAEGTSGKEIHACCTDIGKELKAAEAENEKLKKLLGVGKLPDESEPAKPKE